MLVVTDLTFRIAGRTLIEGASVVVPTGAKAGLVGRNGTGKTTLFRLLTGEWSAESGDVRIPKGARIGQVAQEAPGSAITLIDFVLAADRERASLLAEAETATDPARIGEIHARLADIGAHSAESRAATILAGLGFSHEAQLRPCSDFSGGWRMRVALAAVLFSEPDLLLLDEPTNYLDLEGTLWLEDYVRRYPHTVVIISHDRDLLDTAVDMIVHLDQGKLVAYRGGYTSFERQRREKMILNQKAKEKQDVQRAHLQAFVDRFRAKATKARQAQSRLKAIARLAPIDVMVEEHSAPISFPQPVHRLSPPILALDDVTVGYEPGKPILKKIGLRIDEDDRIALLGSNGNGKSTFAKLIAGRLEPFSGRVSAASRLSVAYFAQHQLDELRPSETPVQHVQPLMPDAPEARVRSRVAQMGLSTSRMDTPAENLSGGEKARLLIGLAAFHGPNLLILDEPTNHLDIDSREALVHALNDYEGAVILISHDRHLVEATADRLIVVADGTVKEFDGDIDDYRRLVIEGPAAPPSGPKTEEPARPTALDRRRAAAALRESLAPLRKKIRDTESAIEKAQADIARLDQELADPDLFTRDSARGTKLMKTRSDREKALAEAEERWLELSAEYEAAERAALDE
jgi:ATP-binding cassette subfamily F protein 3